MKKGDKGTWEKGEKMTRKIKKSELLDEKMKNTATGLPQE